MTNIDFKLDRFLTGTLAVLLGILLFVQTESVFAESAKSSPETSLVSSLRIDTPLAFCDERVPLEIQEVRERLEKELLLTLWDRPQVILWLKRSRRYLPYIEEMLRKNEFPGDLKYIALAESALRPHAGSPKGAMGFWQFMQDTGRRYGLVINNRIDQRRNIFSSTQAAMSYFNDLYKKFGSWTLAAAAYNMGEDGLAGEIREQRIRDYYLLYLPIETQRYIFRIISVKLILSEPKKYGFQLSDGDYYPPLEFDRVEVNCFRDTHLRIIAEAAKTHFKEIKDLNPEIRGYALAAGKYTILIPKGSAKGFESRYRSLLNHQGGDDEVKKIYVVKEGDTLTSIADRFGVALSTIVAQNRLNPKTRLRPGEKLIINVQEGTGEYDNNEGKGASPIND